MNDNWPEHLHETALLTALFLLPWQTRWMFSTPALHGGAWEYGVAGLYAVELLILAAVSFGDRKKMVTIAGRHAWPLATVVALACLSAAFGPAPAVSFLALIPLAFAGLLALTLAMKEGSFVHRAGAFVAGLVPAAVLGWIQTLNGVSPAAKWFGLAEHVSSTAGVAVIETSAGRLLRAYGPFSHPNVFGGFLAVGLILSVLLDAKLSSRLRWLNAAISAFLAATLVITFSRSAFLGLAFGLAVLAWQERKRLLKNRAAIALVVGCLLAAVWFRGPLLSRADESNRLEQKSVAERVGQYGEFLTVFRQNPWLGSGTSAYTAALGTVFPERASFDLQPIHNAFLLILAEQGILGFVAWVWLGWNLIRPDSRRFILPVAALLPIALLDHYLWSGWAGLALFAVVFGLLPPLVETAKT